MSEIKEYKINHETLNNYVEFSFMLPIVDLLYNSSNILNRKRDTILITAVAENIGAPIDLELIESNYWNEINSVEVFHGENDSGEFIYFDLLRDPCDQCDMIFLGVRVCRDRDEFLRDIMLKIYTKGSPRSNFIIDYFNQSLCRKVFGSEFYFYRTEENKSRKLNHHG